MVYVITAIVTALFAYFIVSQVRGIVSDIREKKKGGKKTDEMQNQ